MNITVKLGCLQDSAFLSFLIAQVFAYLHYTGLRQKMPNIVAEESINK